MFGFACGRCWERNCNCTQQELDDYKEKCKSIIHEPTQYTKTKPQVTERDVVYKNGVDFYVTSVENGVGYIRHLSNEAELYAVHELTEPYMVVVSQVHQKL